MMKKMIVLMLIGLLTSLSVSRLQAHVAPTETTAVAPASALMFIENRGQFPASVRYQASFDGGVLWLTNDAIWFTLIQPHNGKTLNIRLQGLGEEGPTGYGRVPTTLTYASVGDVPAWTTIRYPNLALTSQENHLVLERLAHSLTIDGPATLRVDAHGLTIIPDLNEWPTLTVPFKGGTTAVVPNLTPTASHLLYSTFLGGGNTEEGYATTADEEGNVYVTGYTSSLIFPSLTGVGEAAHGVDAYVIKVQPDGTAVDYVLWINPSPDQPDDEDYGKGIAVDGTGSVYVAGNTKSPEFCAFVGNPPGYDTIYNGNTDAYVLKINPSGTALDYCTYLGGNDLDQANALSIDEQGNAYVTGGTWSTNFPTTPGAYSQTLTDQRDAFLVKIDLTGTDLIYGSYIGGTGQDEARAIALDEQGNAYITGWSNSADFPTTAGVVSPNFNGLFDIFVSKFNASATDLAYSTYVGGSEIERGYGLQVDASHNAYVTGLTRSTDFPATPGAYDTTFGGGTCDFDICTDAFVFKLNPDATSLIYATFLGSDSSEEGYALGVDSDQRPYLVGATKSATFPTTADAFDASHNGDDDAFLAILSADGTQLDYGSFFGGSDADRGYGLSVMGVGHVAVTGQTRSATFPTTSGAYDTTVNGDYDIYALTLFVGDEVGGLSLTADGPTALGEATTFTAVASAGTGLTYEWDFGDGNSAIGGPIISYTYLVPGTQHVTVTASNAISSQSAMVTVAVLEGVAGLMAVNDGPTSLNAPTLLTASLTGGSDVAYSWDFGDNTLPAMDAQVSHTYAEGGTYTATVTATNLVSSATATTTVLVRDNYLIYLPTITR